MRKHTRIGTFAGLLFTLAGCAGPRLAPIAVVAEHEVDYSGRIAVGSTTLLPTGFEPYAGPEDAPLVTLEALFFSVPADAARSLPVRARSPWAVTLEAAVADRLVASVLRADGHIVHSPRVTLFDGQRGHILTMSQREYISAYELGTDEKRAEGLPILDEMTILKALFGLQGTEPVRSTTTEGIALEARVEVRTDGRLQAEVTLQQAARLSQETATVPVRSGVKLRLDIPVMREEELRTKFEIDEGQAVLLTGLDGDPAGPSTLVLVRLKQAQLEGDD